MDSLEILEINFDTAVQILENDFDQKDVIINHHVNRFLNLSPIYKSSDIFRLKKLCDNIEINVHAHSVLGLDEKSYSAMLFAIILKNIIQ